ncbi:AAA family ATPase [Arcanobacterium phocae]|uniref:AAA family ATPase n=1 Tax=Arcanobacterium phocae TaxID=131112 RepID=UPI001C0EDD0D
MSPLVFVDRRTQYFSLCYFLVNIAKDKHFSTSFGENQLIVLDDPISSFDVDNKYGVIALLRWLVSSCTAGSTETHLCILTHDPSVAYTLSGQMKQLTSGRHNDWELRNGKLESISFENYDIYKIIYSRCTICQ